MSDRSRSQEVSTAEPDVRVRALKRVAEIARREAILALPAAKRAAIHGAQAFFRKFSEEYAKERRKH